MDQQKVVMEDRHVEPKKPIRNITEENDPI